MALSPIGSFTTGKHVFVLSRNCSIRTAADGATLAAVLPNMNVGDIAFVNENGAVLSLSANALLASNFSVVQKISTNPKYEYFASPILNAPTNSTDPTYNANTLGAFTNPYNGFRGFTKNCANAVKPVKAIYTFTVTSTSTAVGQVFGLRVAEDTNIALSPYTELYEYISVTASDSQSTIAAGIVDNFNSRNQYLANIGGMPTLIKSFTNSGATITIEADTYATTFDISTYGNLLGTVANPTPCVFGANYGKLVTQSERAGRTQRNVDIYDQVISEKSLVKMQEPVPYFSRNEFEALYDSVSLFSAYDINHIGMDITKTGIAVDIFLETATDAASGSPEYTALKTALSL